MKSFKEILHDAPDVTVVLKGHESYRAHIHEHKDSELLHEHIYLVNSYANLLVKCHGLERVIDGLIMNYINEWNEIEFAGPQLKLFFVHTIVFHDFGKVNEHFQVLRMKNAKDFPLKSPSVLQPSYGHSYLSTFLFLCYHIQLILESAISYDTKIQLVCHCFFLAYPILQHHSPVLIDVMEKEKYMAHFRGMLEPLKIYAEQYGLILDEGQLNGIFKSIDNIWNSENKKMIYTNIFSLFALIKLNYSLLTAADYLATHEYMNSTEGGNEAAISDFGVFNDRERVEEIIKHLQSYNHNASTFGNIDNYTFTCPQDRSNNNLNKLRQEMAVSLIQTIRKHTEKKLFYIEAPTGGGKTNMSIITVAELLQANPELNKVFYVFPFTTLITQTYSVLKESLGLKEGEIIELHSKAGFSSKKEEDKDGLYGDEKKDYIDNLFALYPVTLLSHVKFFNILKTNRKEDNYLLHRLANSVVVIDEIQSYNPVIWDKMLYFITQYSTYFNVHFILMSATLPKISGLNIGLTQRPDFVDLLPQAREYITNKNFSERVVFNFELFEEEITLEELAALVINKSEQYASEHGSVKTIVEFIYKKSASSFKQIINPLNKIFDRIFVLSGTVLESRRREIVNFIKRNAKDKVNILLITTQVVEAGVDIDMDLGFKNISIIDSDEQLAGRVNRNAYKEGCEVYLFKLDDAKTLYGKDFRFAQTREHIDAKQYEEILKNKDFKFLYEKVMLFIDKNNNPLYKNAFVSYEEDLSKLRFEDTDKNFKIIDQQNESVFVPLKIPVFVEGKEHGIMDDIFSKYEMDFLRQFTVFSYNDFINGAEVWQLYEQLINAAIQKRRNKGAFDIKNKIDFKILQGIMSKFTFSLMHLSKDIEGLKEGFGKEVYGYLYFSHWDEERTEGKPYSYEDGLNSKAFSDSNFI
ncbi:MAG: CRISPR-associated helicase Cas3' [Segetibacter sp.]